MKSHAISAPILCAIGLLMLSNSAFCQEGEKKEKPNLFTLDLHMMARGEIRNGGVVSSTDKEVLDDKSNFILGRIRLIAGYERSWLETKLTVQHQGVWGQAGKGNFNVHEGWAKLKAKNGLFTQIGRQVLAYDDERIIGPNDWTMMGISHDALKLGYEGYGHKVHAILTYNQNTENINGGTFYTGGSLPYKTMQTVWYHYDVPKLPLGASLLFMNVGMQAGEKNKDERTEWQQVIGGYVKYSPKYWSVEGSYYHQLGRNEGGIKINAWMTSVKAQVHPNRFYGLETGYDYLSGDKFFAVPPRQGTGLILHDVIRGFNPIYGSHHKFYGAMDFFYVSTYVNGFTPGLQNAFIGGYVKPLKGLKVSVGYHYLAMATSLPNMSKTLGHEIELTASYQPIKEVNISAGFSYMTGTETMKRLKRASNDGSLRWGWISLDITPRIFSVRW